MPIKSSEQVLQEQVQAMGEELGTLFNRLSTEVTWLRWNWRQHTVLYGAGSERVALLNQVAPFFFVVFQRMSFDDTLLGIARLTGPPRSAGRANLSVKQLPPLVLDKALQLHVEKRVDEVVKAAGSALAWRNRRLAHRDLDLALKRPATPLPAVEHHDVENALKELGGLLNSIQCAFKLGTTAYHSSPLNGDAESLVSTMKDGLRRQEERHAAWDRGETHSDDHLPPLPG